MKAFATLTRGITVAALASLAGGTSALAATFVYVDGASGKLTYLSSTSTERQPRGFAIEPNGRFLVATGEKSDTISVYAIDQASDALKFLNKYPTGKGANWVEIVSFD
jgi:6-phosphogluconolactonase